MDDSLGIVVNVMEHRTICIIFGVVCTKSAILAAYKADVQRPCLEQMLRAWKVASLQPEAPAQHTYAALGEVHILAAALGEACLWPDRCNTSRERTLLGSRRRLTQLCRSEWSEVEGNPFYQRSTSQLYETGSAGGCLVSFGDSSWIC